MAIFNKKDVRTRLPDGIYRVVGESFAPMTFPDNRGKLAGRWGLKLVVRVTEPVEYSNYPLYTDFCLSSEEDPVASEPHTVGSSIHGRLLNDFIVAAGIDLDGIDISEGIDIGGFDVLVHLTTREYKDKLTNETKQIQENVKTFYAVGTKEVYIDNGLTLTPPSTPTKLKTAPKAKAKAPTSAPPPMDAAQNLQCPTCPESFPPAEYVEHYQSCATSASNHQ